MISLISTCFEHVYTIVVFLDAQINERPAGLARSSGPQLRPCLTMPQRVH